MLVGKISKLIGIAIILLTLLALVPSFVPGVISMLGFVISIFLLIISIIISARTKIAFYFKTSAMITCIGIFLINDGLRFYNSLPEAALQYKLIAYGVFTITCIIGHLATKRKKPSIYEIDG